MPSFMWTLTWRSATGKSIAVRCRFACASNVSISGQRLFILGRENSDAGLLPLAYAAVLTCLLLQAFRMMLPSSASRASTSNNRTGLQTTHPELLDENGEVTNEELWAVPFSDEGLVLPEA